MDHSPRAMKTDGNTESCAGTKKEPLVRRMATPNVVTKESPDTQQTGYGLKVVKKDDDTADGPEPRAMKTNVYTEDRVRQSKALTHSGRATVRRL